MLRKAPASAAGTRAWPQANSTHGTSVPTTVRARTPRTGPVAVGVAGAPSPSRAIGRAPAAAAMNWTAVTAIGSRPASMSTCATVIAALTASENSTRASPVTLERPPPPPATMATPMRDITRPAQAGALIRCRCQTAAMAATRTGIEPTIIEAWLTLVICTPTFWTTTQTPTPKAPQSRIAGVKAARRWARAGKASSAAARPNRTTVSQPGCSQSSDSLDRAMLEPQSSPAAVRAVSAGGFERVVVRFMFQ